MVIQAEYDSVDLILLVCLQPQGGSTIYAYICKLNTYNLQIMSLDKVFVNKFIIIVLNIEHLIYS